MTVRLSRPAVCLGLLFGLAGSADPGGGVARGQVGPAAADAAAPQTRPAAARKTRTFHDVYRQQLAFNRRTLGEAYKQVGRRNPKWDAPAERYLDGVARLFASATVPPLYRPTNDPPRADLVKAGRAVLALGCDDPLVQYCVAGLTMDEGDRAGAEPLLRTAVGGLRASKYPTFRVAVADNRLARLSTDAAEVDALRQRFRDAAPGFCSGPLDDPARQRMLDTAWDALTGRDEQQAFVDALKARPDADPWVRDVAAGRLHIQLAWDSRGSGWASTVTRDGWKGFADHLKQARDALTRAHDLAPHLPEAATYMITVAMGGGGSLVVEDESVWFARALDAQVDDTEAYQRMVNALLPRWGGSYEAMYDLAQACIEQPRYDTVVPWKYVWVVEQIGKDAEQPWGMLEDPDVYANVVRVAAETAKAAPGRNGDYFKTAQAAAAWRTGRMADARRALDELTAAGGKPSVEAFAFLGADDAKKALAEVYAATGPHADALAEADRLAEAGDKRAAAAALKAVAAKLPAGDPAAGYVGTLLKGVEADLAFDAGDWAPLQWTESLKDWESVEGQWTTEPGGAIVGRNDLPPKPGSGGGGARPPARTLAKSLMWRGRDPGDAYEVAGTVEFLPYPEDGAYRCGGVVIQGAANRWRGFVVLDPRVPCAGYSFGPDLLEVATPVKTTSEFRVRVDGRALRLWVDGARVGGPFEVPDRYEGKLRFGLGGFEGSGVRYTNLRVRKAGPLPPEPPPPVPAGPGPVSAAVAAVGGAVPATAMGVAGGALLLAGAVAGGRRLWGRAARAGAGRSVAGGSVR